MAASQGMPFVTGSDTDSEVRASNERPHTENLEFIRVFDPAMVSLGRKIGEGSQACVYEAKFYAPFSFMPLPVVVKRFKPFVGVSQGHFPPELTSSKGITVCRPAGVVFKEDSLCTIMARFPCDLHVHIDSRMKALRDEDHDYNGPPFDYREAIYIILQLARGLKALHESGIYHRDLKSTNILVMKSPSYGDGRRYPQTDIVIADYERTEDVVGSGFYRAPEVLQFVKRMTEVRLSEDQWLAADIYSFGMVCYEVLTGGIPFNGHQYSDYDLVLKGGRPELPDHVPEFAKDIIQRCWHADPSSRPSWTDIIQVLTENAIGDLTSHIDNLASLEWSVESSIESVMVKLKQSLQAHVELDAPTSKGFASYVYWAEEFIATAEEYVSKFHVEFPSENPLLCKFSEYLERKKLVVLLHHQLLGCGFTLGLSQHWKGEIIFSSNSDFQFEANLVKQPEEICFLIGNVLTVIGKVDKQVKFAKELDEETSLIGKLLFWSAFIKWHLWTESAHQLVLPPLGNPEDGADAWILLVCVLVAGIILSYLHVVLLFTYEPIMLCLQYGLFRIKGCNNFLYRSSGYRICRLQRAWINYTRYRLVSVALILSLMYVFSSYKWKGVLGWIVFPCILRINILFWRRAIPTTDEVYGFQDIFRR